MRHVLYCTLEVDGVAACWPLKGDIGSDGCRIDVLEADGWHMSEVVPEVLLPLVLSSRVASRWSSPPGLACLP